MQQGANSISFENGTDKWDQAFNYSQQKYLKLLPFIGGAFFMPAPIL
jgi:hypothetical protein